MHGRIATSACACWFWLAGICSGQLCPATGLVPSPDEGGAWVVTNVAPACELADGGFLKKQESGTAPAAYRIHFKATVTGGCQTQTRICGGFPTVCSACFNSTYYVRNLGTSSVFDNTVLFGYVAANAGYPQHYDTSVPVGTLGTGWTWKPLSEGTHTFDGLIRTNATPCYLQPTQSWATPFEANVIACKPAWWEHPLSGLTFHAPPGRLNVWVPSLMRDQLEVPTRNAIAAWNTALQGVAYFEWLEDPIQDCGSGGDCIKIEERLTADGCAGTESPELWDANGVVTVARRVFLPTTPPDRDWRQRSSDRLTRTMLHELGHTLGLGDFELPCTLAQALMGSATSGIPESEKCKSMQNVTLSPMPSDVLPTLGSTYGNGVKSTCGF